MSEQPVRGINRELFRHARVEAPRVLDLTKRQMNVPKGWLQKEGSASSGRAERLKWARAHLTSDERVGGLDDLKLEVLTFLTFPETKPNLLPSVQAISDKRAFGEALTREAPALAASRKKVATSLFAAMLAGEAEQIDRLSHALQVLEALPGLDRIKIERPFAPVVLTRHTELDKPAQAAEPAPSEVEDTGEGPRAILMAWDLAQEYRAWGQATLKARRAALKARKFNFEEPKLSARLTEKTRTTKLKEARSRQYRAYAQARVAERAAISLAREELESANPRQVIEQMVKDKTFADLMMKTHGIRVDNSLAKVDLKGGLHGGFCAIYKDAAESAEKSGRPDRAGCEARIDNACVKFFGTQRRPLLGGDDVRMLGVAELITVDQTFMGYQPGEISAVETVLKGELRKKEMKSARYSEQISEDTSTTTDEKEAETTTTTEQELSTQIEQELSTRFSTDLNAEASGEAGGTIGVVNFEGAASLGSAVGVGVDSALSQSSDDRFSQEIVARALERTKSVTTKLRRQRSYQLQETTILNKIDNTSAEAKSFNAVYCFLDKEVCIQEKLYGLRQFMGAEIMRPGRALLDQELRRHVVDLAEQGRVPDFGLTPAKITPANYMSLVGKYRAANVMPPPPIMRMESRTYKTDPASEARAPQKGMVESVGDVLAPFFGEYKRYLIQDQIDVPEGYRLQQVDITVSHGQNGVSIPAHLPFSVLGAAIYAAPTLGAAAIPPYTFFYLPVAVWQMLYTASPLMHVHADSSHVTMTVGHQSEESRYFFFDPEEMLRDVLEAVEASTVLDTSVLSRLGEHLTALYTSLGDPGEGSLQAALQGLSAPVQDYLTSLHTWLGSLATTVLPFLNNETDDGDTASFEDLLEPPQITPALLAEVPKAIIAPFETFFTAVLAELGDLMNDVLGDLFAFLEAETRNVDSYRFGQVSGMTGGVPVSLNCVALKPGVTVNLTACLVRIEEEALAMWQLETFERLSQAHAQLEAEHAATVAAGLERPVMRGNPKIMRAEEKMAMKVRVMDRLHGKYSDTPDQPMTLDEARLFEHVIDWENMTYRLFNYGPEGAQIAHEALGLYATADRGRRSYLDAAWAKVMLPLREDERLEQVFLSYLRYGKVDFEADLLGQLEGDTPVYDELTAIYRDLVLRRNREPGRIISAKTELIPTDQLVIYEGTPDDPYPSSDVICAVQDPETP